MKTINYKNDLTPDQYNVLSYYATRLYSGCKDSSYLRGLQAGCTFAGVPDSLLYAVSIERNFTGLRNYNKMSYILLFN